MALTIKRLARFFFVALPIALFWDLPMHYFGRYLRRPTWEAAARATVFLRGNYAPVPETEVTSLRITGSLPADLPAGTYLRNGPNPRWAPPSGSYHWFDGDGHLHAVTLNPADNTASYRNRWVVTERFLDEERARCAVYRKLGDIITPRGMLVVILSTIIDQLAMRFGCKKPAGSRINKSVSNTAVIYHDRRVLTLVEADHPYHVRAPALQTVGRYDYDGALKHPMTAHPKIDPNTGEMVMFGYRLDRAPYCLVSLVNAAGQLTTTIPINHIDVPVMMHDFALTTNYAILFDLPLTFRVSRLLDGEGPLQFEPTRRSRFGLLQRTATTETGMRWFEAPPCYIFHTAAAWEEGNKVILVAFKSEETSVGRTDWQTRVADPAQREREHPRLTRFEFDLLSNTTTVHTLCATPGEFPVINPRFTTSKTRYVYFAVLDAGEGLAKGFTGVAKLDLETKALSQLNFPKGHLGGEPAFVPKNGSTAEDDGYLLVLVYNPATNSSEMMVYEAATFGPDSVPHATLHLPRVPFGFHGQYVLAEELAKQR